jgi:hypothetical protein
VYVLKNIQAAKIAKPGDGNTGFTDFKRRMETRMIYAREGYKLGRYTKEG